MTDQPDLLYDTLGALETEIAMRDIALLCREAEDGKGADAAKKLMEQLGPGPAMLSLMRYAELTEKEIISFYGLKKAVEIKGKWGAFVLSHEYPAKCYDGPPVLTPIGLWALATHIGALIEKTANLQAQGSEDGY